MPKRVLVAKSAGPGSKPSAPQRLHGEFRLAQSHLRTVRDLVRFAVTRFEAAHLAYGHGTDNALDEAAYLVLRTLNLPPDRPDAFLDARVLPAEASTVLAVLQQRVRARIPAAYITREAWIGTHRFYVDERVIVPRSYIGQWLCDDLNPWIESPESIRNVLELCTGSGCLAVLLALAMPSAEIDAVDVSAEALQVARINVTDFQLDARVRLLRGDLFAAVAKRRYDLIVANPPYVSSQAMARLPAEYRHEPEISLAGGSDGLAIVRRIMSAARSHLTPHGMLIMEVGHARTRVEAAFPQIPFTWLEIDGVDDAVLLLRRDQLGPARAGA